MTNCCFTGHRFFKIKDCNELSLRSKLENAIKSLIQRGIYVFYTGMAQGVDLLAAQIIIDMKEDDPRLNLIGVVPFKGQSKNWPEHNKQLYDYVYNCCEQIHTISERYYSRCFFDRNEFMVDRCEYVIGVFNGEKGGTKYTLDYAKKMDRKIILIEP